MIVWCPRCEREWDEPDDDALRVIAVHVEHCRADRYRARFEKESTTDG